MPTAAVPAAPTRGDDLSELVLSIVAEKTGYPRDILAPDMDLEADLGIDSIKRVQIFAAVHDAHPGLPEVNAQQMAGLRTLAAIMEYLGHTPEAAAAVQPKSVKDIEELVLGVVARKDGLSARNSRARYGSGSGPRNRFD